LNNLAGQTTIGSDTPLPGFVLVDEEFAQLKRTLTPAEQHRYRTLCSDCAEILYTVAHSITPQQTEREISAKIVRDCYLAGIVPMACSVGADRRPRRYRYLVPDEDQVFHYAVLALGTVNN
jgi:hypothetical protein